MNDDEPEDRPRKKKKKKQRNKSNIPLIIGIVAGVLLLAGGIVALAAIMRKKDHAQTKGPPPAPLDKQEPTKFQPKPKKGKDLVSAIARRTEATEVSRWFQQLGVAYTAESISDVNGVGPRGFEQLGPNFRSTPLKDWLDKKWIVIVWNVRLPHVQEKSSTALAWETDADSLGNRIVLMCDGSVQTMDEARFARTPKAKGR